MYEEPQGEQDDQYEPPPSHAALPSANSASFSTEDYLGREIRYVGKMVAFVACFLFFYLFISHRSSLEKHC